MPDEIEQAYSTYKAEPSPDNLTAVVTKLKPTIGYALAQHGAADDPLVHSKALLYAADAVESYDPKYGASLPTHVSHSLRQLSRAVRQSRAPVRIPERVQLDAFKLHQATQEFIDERGREPDTWELADYAQLPVKRIEKIRTFQMAIPSEEATGDIEKHVPDMDHEALDYIMHDADHTDRRILEMKTGYGGHPVLSPKEIAVALNLTPTQLTRRSMRLTKRINDIRASLEKL
jgi:hypothetical protein